MNSRNDVPSKTVLEQRAMFEQGNNRNRVEEMENRILQATHAERQRELNMLRSRFNANREVARTAAGSCLRTSESSEGGGKSSSPKNSPVCPVKPTPAPVSSYIVIMCTRILRKFYRNDNKLYILFIKCRIISLRLRRHHHYHNYHIQKSYRITVNLLQ